MAHRILVCADTYPYPPDRGDRIRYALFLEAIQSSHEVEVALVRRQTEAEERPAARVHDLTASPARVAMNVARGIFGGIPAQFSAFRWADAERAIGHLARRADAFVALGARAATYRPAAPGLPGLLDLQDSLVLNARSQWKGAAGLPRRLYGADAILKARSFETKVVRSFDVVTVAGPADLEAIRRDTPGADCRVIPVAVAVPPHIIDPRANGRRVLFVGDLRFAPNADAVTHLIDEIWPRVVASVPEARLLVVGHQPRAQLRRKLVESGHGCAFSVADTTPYLRSARVFVAPMRLGSGIKVKVLHALAEGIPVVMSGVANDGIGAVDGVEALVANDPETIAQQMTRLLQEDDLALRLAHAGHALVRDRFAPGPTSDMFVQALEDAIDRYRTSRRNE